MSVADVENPPTNLYGPPELCSELKEIEQHYPGDVSIDYAKYEYLKDLGEGQFGVVKLKYSTENPNENVAVKTLKIDGNPQLLRKLASELAILMLVRRHPNIVSLKGRRGSPALPFYEIYLEYCDGGELFDRIEPEIGMEFDDAKFFFMQLVQALDYIHSKGICHRDIKPENILLTSRDIVKLSDFGLATIYKTAGKERILTQVCGTPQYAAPEVLVEQKYRGPPADIWSAGVTMLVALTGIMPWEYPSAESHTFKEFAIEKKLTGPPFNKLDIDTLIFLQSLITMDVEKRTTIEKIKESRWFTTDPGRRSPNPMAADTNDSSAATQPAQSRKSMYDQSLSQLERAFDADRPKYAFSQPLENELLLFSQAHIGASQATVFHPLHSFARRMTRFCAEDTIDELVCRIEEACATLGYSTSVQQSHQILVMTTYGRRTVHFVIQIFEVRGGKLLVDVRRSRGLGMDFKNVYKAFRSAIDPFVLAESDTWLKELGLIPETPKSAPFASSNGPLKASNSSAVNCN
ncbi:unnamed protein product [Bursaphelenchus xylophilus]|uniref:non-specific serine/threonine protein kinase n=1 Tax=Bursaphelenchus xylophilus TaxID=6326 RepID=A0A1I7S2V2_BURXY|nr:unnamed protein product [Bursaphelenchus xylophilus]CAG9121579.1 unnamed protein product [Bursaphelenchus xylophilus]